MWCFRRSGLGPESGVWPFCGGFTRRSTALACPPPRLRAARTKTGDWGLGTGDRRQETVCQVPRSSPKFPEVPHPVSQTATHGTSRRGPFSKQRVEARAASSEHARRAEPRSRARNYQRSPSRTLAFRVSAGGDCRSRSCIRASCLLEVIERYRIFCILFVTCKIWGISPGCITLMR
jgi:hypothetical protein